MKHKGRIYFVLTLILILVLAPIGGILSGLEIFKKTNSLWIFAILLGIAILYYSIFTYFIFFKGKKK